MGLNRFAKRKDSSQEAIVKALRKAGVRVWILDTPADLLCRYMSLWSVLEVKANSKSALTPAQKKFIAENDVPIVTNPEEALRALGVI
jgi:hypothetical protein